MRLSFTILSLFLLVASTFAGVRPQAPAIVNDGINAIDLFKKLYGGYIHSSNTNNIKSCGKAGAVHGEQCFYFTLNPNDNDNGNSNGKARSEIIIAKNGTQLITKGSTWKFKWSFFMDPNNEVNKDFFNIHQFIGKGNPLLSWGARQDRFYINHKQGRWNDIVNTTLSSVTGKWIDVEETVFFETAGSYQARLTDSVTGKVILDVPKTKSELWTPGVCSKWGIYRRLGFTKATRIAFSAWQLTKV